MKKIIQILLLFVLTQSWGQIDFSNTWEDFYSYNNVKDFVKVDNNLLAISDNAFFSYNSVNEELHTTSSINGLSGESTSSICFSKTHNKTIIGYETGLLEIIDNDGNILIAKDIINFNYT